jgi:hypothetical protein
MASERSWVLEFCDQLDREAHSLDRSATTGADFTAIEKRMLRLHANVKRGVATALRFEARKVRRG